MRPRSYADLFPRLVGAIYTISFASLLVQVRGLFGSHGLRPLGLILPAAWQVRSWHAPLEYPSVFWISRADTFLVAMTWLGILAGLALIVVPAGRRRIAAAASAWFLYLSWVSVGEPFLSFQWDALLLETGFLTIVLAIAGRAERWTTWALRLLLFRLMFASGLAKLLSGDPTWRSLTALTYHYETQPLPTPLAWYLHQLPAWFHRASAASTFIIELALPLGLFLGRRARRLAAGGFVLLMALILVSGNYGIFNWLTLALVPWWLAEPDPVPAAGRRENSARAVAIGLLLLGALRMADGLAELPHPLAWPAELAGKWDIVNSYGLFAVMTTERDEIEILGTADGVTWKPYRFRYKPSDPARRPPWVAPHMPRLDWQMWFAALDPRHPPDWLATLADRLADGSPEVLGLFEENPFADHPPRDLRFELARYRFTRPGESGWWKREPVGSH